MATQRIASQRSSVVPLIAISLGLAGLYRAAQALGDVLQILESAGAIGGTRGER